MRTLVVTYDFEEGREYQITRTLDLKCDGAAGNPAVVWDVPYEFTVVDNCYPDIDNNGMVDADDLIAVIVTWGPCGSPPCAADIVPLPCGNGAIDSDDLVMVILNWGLNCSTMDYDDIGSLQSVQDCMDKASEYFTPYSPEWDEMVTKCIEALCEAEIIDCD